MKEIRHPQRIITDPLPSPKTKSKLMKTSSINRPLGKLKFLNSFLRILAAKVAKKGTHVKTAKKRLAQSPSKQIPKKQKKVAKSNNLTDPKAKKLQDPTVSGSTDISEVLAPNRVEAKVLRSIKTKLKSLGMSPPDQETLDDVRNKFRKQMAAMATDFIDKAFAEITVSLLYWLIYVRLTFNR